MRVLFISLISLVIFSSCWSSARTYKASSPIEPISHIPIDTKEKGDVRLELGFQGYTGNSEGQGGTDKETDVMYIAKGVEGCHISAAVALTDRIALMGLYRYTTNEHSFSANTVGGGFNYNLPLKIKKEKVRRDFDVFAGVQYRNTRNYMELNGYEYYERLDGELIYPDTLGKVPLANYNIHDRYIRYYIQPSFMLERKNFSFYLGMAFAFQQQLKMDVQENILRDHMYDPKAKNPLQDRFINRGNTFYTELFTGIGAGPEFCRLNVKMGFGGGAADVVSHVQMGLTSNLNIKKLSEQRRSKKAAKQESLGPLYTE